LASGAAKAPKKPEPPPQPITENNKPLSFELKGIVYHPYLQSRGVSQEVAAKFGIGFFPGKGSMQGRIVIPIRDEKGALVAYAGRALNGDEPKYRLPVGFHKSKILSLLTPNEPNLFQARAKSW